MEKQPEILCAKMIDRRHLEVYWNQNVVNSEYSENIGVYQGKGVLQFMIEVILKNGIVVQYMSQKNVVQRIS